MSKIYRHYGSESFDINRYTPIKNIDYFTKPSGGFWGTPKDSNMDWRSWCFDNEFHIETLGSCFEFTLNDTAKIITIKSHKDMVALRDSGFAMDVSKFQSSFRFDIFLDYEKLLEHGYDAIEVVINGDTYWDLYGWDCDSILVMNPEILIF